MKDRVHSKASRCRCPQGSRRARGSAAVEAALSMVILFFMAMGAFHIGYAIFVRQRLTSVTSRAARVCSVYAGQQSGAGDPEACALQLANNALAPLRQGNTPACSDASVIATKETFNGVSILTVETVCQYTGGPWAGFVNNLMVRANQAPLVIPLRASSSMPLFL